MSRKRNIPDRENCSLNELEIAARASKIQRTYMRVKAIRALIMGFTHQHVAELFDVNEDSVSRWVRRFNERGADGITEGPRCGRRPKISGERTGEYRELTLHPELVNEIHWTCQKFHGYLPTHCQLEAA